MLSIGNVMRLCLLCLSSTVALADFSDALEAYEKAEYDTAFAEFSVLAELNDPRAQYYIGLMFDEDEVTLMPEEITDVVTNDQDLTDEPPQMDVLERIIRESRLNELKKIAEMGKAIKYLERLNQNDRQAVYWYRLAAEQGHVEAQIKLGYKLWNWSEGDDLEAVRWTRLAAEQGNIVAQNELGRMYALGGDRVPVNGREAVRWLRVAAERGHVEAQANLGRIYDNGEGVPEDDREAVKWYRLAAGQGYYPALLKLGRIYDEGLGIPEDVVQAYAWYNLSAAEGVQSGHEAKTAIAERMTQTQIEKAQRLSRILFECDMKLEPECEY